MYQRPNRTCQLFLLIASIFILSAVCQSASGECPRLQGNDLDGGGTIRLVSLTLTNNSTQPELLDYPISCIARSTTAGNSTSPRTVSGVAQMQNESAAFHFRCECAEDGNTTAYYNTSDLVLIVSNATSDEEPRSEDCTLCVSPEHQSEADNITSNCVSYASECNGTALLRCMIEESSDCCVYFSPDVQCVNGSCPGTSMFNQEASECICSSNYSPRNECMADVDACEDSPCENGATCTSVNGSFVCDCPAGYTGRTCNVDINNGSVCMNGGELSTDGESCNCTEGWSGQYCDVCTLEGCVNCTADESQNYTAVCIECGDGYRLENQTCIMVDCLVDGCVNCSNSSSEICEECEDGLTISADGSNCSLITDAPSTSEDARTTTVVSGMTTGAAQPFITTGRLIGIVVGSVVGGILLILLAIVVTCAVYRRKKSRVTLTFDMNTIKAAHITANPAFEDVGREDSGIENDDEITVNRGALGFEDD